jgi:hypothetical protein
VLVKNALYKPGIKKVVLILHSQGGIEGSMILDWLLDEVPQDLLQYLEVYTFGCLANHFNNPRRQLDGPHAADSDLSSSVEGIMPSGKAEGRAISHIEHYANASDLACIWGVMNSTRNPPEDQLQNRFMGRVFVNPRTGHQFNQHYLDSLFPLDPTIRFARDAIEGDFMDMYAQPGYKRTAKVDASDDLRAIRSGKKVKNGELGSTYNGTDHNASGMKMGEVSRLWQYRNGRCPAF